MGAQMGEALANQVGTVQALTIRLVEEMADRLPDTFFYVKNADGRYLSGNARVARLAGLQHSRELVGRHPLELYPGDLARYYGEVDAEVMGAGRRLIDHFDPITGRFGDRCWYLFSRFPLRDQRGQLAGTLGLSRRLAHSAKNARLHARVAAVAAKLQSDPAAAFDGLALSALAGVSQSQLERDFDRVLGTTPQRYKLRLRLQHAMTLLATDEPIAQIALACGYADQSAFSRRFRSEIGLSPSAFRRSRRHELAALTCSVALFR